MYNLVERFPITGNTGAICLGGWRPMEELYSFPTFDLPFVSDLWVAEGALYSIVQYINSPQPFWFTLILLHLKFLTYFSCWKCRNNLLWLF